MKIGIGQTFVLKERHFVSKLKDDFFKKFVGSTAPRQPQVYTGVHMIGIAQIPKSNAQPVFSRQAALDTVKVK